MSESCSPLFSASLSRSASVAGLVAALVSIAPLLAAPGDLDPSFGDGGNASTNINASASDAALQADGRIVVLAHTNEGPLVARFLHSGELDPSFGEAGSIVIDLPGFEAEGIAVQPDGRIVIPGSIENPSRRRDFALVRLALDGSYDSAFSDDGVAILPYPAPNAIKFDSARNRMVDVAVQSNGKLLAFGVTNAHSRGTQLSLARLCPDGTLDSTYAEAGLAFFQPSTAGGLEPHSVLLQSDGNVIVAGTAAFAGDRTDFFVGRRSQDGSRDSFGRQGWASASFALAKARTKSVAVLPSGQIVLAGNVSTHQPIGNPFEDFGIAQFTPNGSPDPSFGTNGKRIIAVDSAENTAAGSVPGVFLVPRPDGKLVLAGWSPLTLGWNSWTLARLNADGSDDVTLSDDGTLRVPWGVAQNPGQVTGILSQPDGKVVVIRSSRPLTLARYFLDSDSDGDGADDPTETIIWGTDPQDPDTDGDGLLDGSEISQHQTNPLNPDSDGDGLSDFAEVDTYSSDPNQADSDGDGLSDFDEVSVHGSSPVRVDTDGDGVEDPDELLAGTGIADPDSDDDGVRDGEELALGINPLAPDSDGDGFLDLYEINTGKSPSDPNDKPALIAKVATAIEYTFPSAIGKAYRIEASTDLIDWETVEAGIAGTGGEIQRFYTTKGQPKRFLRIEEESP